MDLALAIILSSNAPLLMLDADLRVIGASTSFCRAFDIDPGTVQGRDIFALGSGEWNVPQLRSLLTSTLSGDIDIEAYELDFITAIRGVRRLVVNAHKLQYEPNSASKLLLTMLDVTEARAATRLNDELMREKDDLLRQKAILLQEVQHRVANSLQIIASVLMQSARRVQSEETRAELKAAHNRVMSVAAVQKQLASSAVGDVLLRPYFTQLCKSLGASMIRDENQLKLIVHIDESAVDPDVSISLGLIVTELVINALKHAFPHHRKGTITVGYQSEADGWVLSVGDDGVGMAMGTGEHKPGLGTSIVEALAKQLDATVSLEPVPHGTTVTIAHGARPALVATD
ncbi:sensor histidine kinase [Phreatobacter aquaticus]|nr:histidine kinase dimerization/phosphoacceptor domain -containing protein [Phreatobacter aquaticus]